MSVPIVDMHCHYGRGDGFTGPWDTSADITRYLTRARRAGITLTVLFPVFCSDYWPANKELARLVDAHPSRYRGFVMVHPVRDRGRAASMARHFITRHHFCGIKVHRHDGKLTREICEAASRYRVPVLYDVMDHTHTVELFAREFPDVSFIIPHLGSFGDNWKAQKILIDCLVRLPNVYADTSGIRRFDLLREAVDRAGAGKILFGSDGPWLHPGLELAKVRALGLHPVEYRKVVSGNFFRLTLSKDEL